MMSPEFLQNSIVIMLIGYAFAIAFQLYVLYLNWKQSKVNDQMTELINEVKKIKKELVNLKSSNSKFTKETKLTKNKIRK